MNAPGSNRVAKEHMSHNNLAIILNSKKTIRAWAFFDWANSSYALVIAVAIFPNYFIQMTDDEIALGSLHVSNSSLYAFAISTAYLLLMLMVPILSGIADYSGRKMVFLRFFTIMGSMACSTLFFFQGMPQLALALACFIIAMVGFDGGKVFYNAYLPLIVTPDRFDLVSARGFAYGYIGSVLLLLFNLVMILRPELFGIPSEGTLATRLAFLMVGIWWISFAQITFRGLPKEVKIPLDNRILKKGFEELRQVWRELKPQKNTKLFLWSFFCYSAGVQTILFLAATFAEKELAFGTSELIIVVLILQLLAIGGAYLFALISKWQGNKRSLLSMLVIWILVCLLAYAVHQKFEFYLVAALVGMVMGGIQSMSRSTYSKLIAGQSESTSYFSFYEVLEKAAIVFGTMSFGLINQVSGNMRNSMLMLSIFFFAGILLLWRVSITKVQGDRISVAASP